MIARILANKLVLVLLILITAAAVGYFLYWLVRRAKKDLVDDEASAAGLAVLGLLAVLALIVTAISVGVAMTTIDPGHRAVVYNQWSGREGTYEIGEGFSWVNPYVYEVYELDTRNKLHRVTTEGVTRDQQLITTEVAVRYHINKQDVTNLVFEFKEDPESMCIDPAVQESVKSVVARDSALNVSTVKRAWAKGEITALLNERAAECYITVDEVDVTDFDYSAEVNAAIEAKQRAEQDLLREKSVQQQKVIAAQAEYEAAVLRAQATEREAEAKAYAAKVVQANLTAEYLHYVYLSQWNGVLPSTVLGEDAGASILLGRVAS